MCLYKLNELRLRRRIKKRIISNMILLLLTNTRGEIRILLYGINVRKLDIHVSYVSVSYLEK